MEFDDSVKNGLILKAGDLLKLPAVVTGRPQPEVKWTKDESEVDKERAVIETEGKNSVLLIKKVVRADHGRYQITGTNSSGSKIAETRVDVMGECHMTLTLPKCRKESIMYTFQVFIPAGRVAFVLCISFNFNTVSSYWSIQIFHICSKLFEVVFIHWSSTIKFVYFF